MSKYLIDDRPIMFLPKLAEILNSCEKALVLQQIHWLCNQPKSGTEHDGHTWVWGTYADWCEDYFPMWKPDTLKKHILGLEKDGWLFSTQLRAADWDRTKYYRVNLAKFEAAEEESPRSNGPDAVRSNGPDAVRSNGPDAVRSYTETSTETSTVKKEDEDGDKPLTSGDVHKLWQNNMPGMLTAIIVDDINDLVGTYGAEEVAEAITQSVRNNGRSIRYVQKVLENRASGKDKQPHPKEMVKVRVMVKPSRGGDAFEDIISMSASEAKAGNYTIVEA